MEKILVTGCSGFIGMHLSLSLLDSGYHVTGVDDMNNYYDISLKEARLKKLLHYNKFEFFKGNIADRSFINYVFDQAKPVKVVNLAAQAGVRYSLQDPHAYINTNIVGFMNILEVCRHSKVQGLIYASSSSVYGSNEKHPFSIKDRVENPISIMLQQRKLMN